MLREGGILSMDPGMALGSLDMGSDRIVTGSQMAAVSFLYSLVGKVFKFIKRRGIVLLLVSMTARARRIPFSERWFSYSSVMAVEKWGIFSENIPQVSISLLAGISTVSCKTILKMVGIWLSKVHCMV